MYNALISILEAKFVRKKCALHMGKHGIHGQDYSVTSLDYFKKN